MYNVLKLTDESYCVQLLKGFSMNVSAGAHAYATFHGITKKDIALREQGDFAVLSGKIISGSVLLDTEIKSWSFQDVSMTYKNIIEQVLKDTHHAGAVFAAGTYDESINKPIIQYRETDWQFINRLASRCLSCIIPDITQSKPWIYFGVKKGGQAVTFNETESTQTANEKFYCMGADDAGWNKGDYYHTDVESVEDYKIGDTATIHEKALVICEKSATYKRNEVIFSYRLAKESYNQAKRYDNQKISGMTLLGTVLETAEETLKIHLDIDREQDPGTAYPYHWVPPSGSLMYLMPTVGTRVSLYCPDSDEQNARAINCVRTNGGADGLCEAMGNFENRCLTTEHGKQMYFHPGTMGFIGGSGMLSQTDEMGTMLRSGLPISIKAKEQIKINAPKVTLKAKQELTAIQGEN